MKSTHNNLAQRERMGSVGEHQHSVTGKVRTGHCWGWQISLLSHLLLFQLGPLVSLNWMCISTSLSYIFFLNQPLADSDSIVNRAHNDYRSTLPPAMPLSYLRDF